MGGRPEANSGSGRVGACSGENTAICEDFGGQDPMRINGAVAPKTVLKPTSSGGQERPRRGPAGPRSARLGLATAASVLPGPGGSSRPSGPASARARRSWRVRPGSGERAGRPPPAACASSRAAKTAPARCAPCIAGARGAAASSARARGRAARPARRAARRRASSTHGGPQSAESSRRKASARAGVKRGRHGRPARIARACRGSPVSPGCHRGRCLIAALILLLSGYTATPASRSPSRSPRGSTCSEAGRRTRPT